MPNVCHRLTHTLMFLFLFNTLSQAEPDEEATEDLDLSSLDLNPRIRTAYRRGYSDYPAKSVLQCLTPLPPPLTFAWYLDKKKIEGANSEFFTFTDDEMLGGVFVCTVFRPGFEKPLQSKPIVYATGSSITSSYWQILLVLFIRFLL